MSIKIGVIPAAGEGTRMGYLGKILPKCLFPLYDKPIIHHIIDNMEDVGIEQIYVIVNYQKDKIIEYLGKTRDSFEVDIDFIEQKHLSGISDAIKLTEKYCSEPFITILGDDCTITKSLQNLVDIFLEREAIVVEGVVKESNNEILKSTCCVKLDESDLIIAIEEKPLRPFSSLRGCGLYVFRDEIYDFIGRTPISHKRGEIEITDTIRLITDTKRAYGASINGSNININTYDDLLRAWILLRMNRSDL